MRARDWLLATRLTLRVCRAHRSREHSNRPRPLETCALQDEPRALDPHQVYGLTALGKTINKAGVVVEKSYVPGVTSPSTPHS